jgi:homoserine O-acetyltransferase
MIGPDKAIDTNKHFVLCPSLLGGTSGTTGPTSINPATDQPYGNSFPAISVGDLVQVHLRLLDQLGISSLHAVIGGSLGAMQATELGIRHPGRCRHVITISGTDFTRPYTAAIRHIGRRAIQLDPAFKGGDYRTHGPDAGLTLARQVGTLYYRSREEFNSRFPRQPINKPSRDGITFEVQSYLEYQGKKAVGQFDANSYLTLSLAMDLHDLWRGANHPSEILAPVDAEFLTIGVPEDRLIPHDEQLSLHEALLAAGKSSAFFSMSSQIGHDAFLADVKGTGKLVGAYLEKHHSTGWLPAQKQPS